MGRALKFILAAGVTSGAASGSSVLMTSTGDAFLDAEIEQAIESYAHDVTIGPQYADYAGFPSPVDYPVVLVLVNENWQAGDMPDAGQVALRDFVAGGGGLLTGEWLVWKHDVMGEFQILFDAIPVKSTSAFRSSDIATFTRAVPESTLNAGVPDVFTFPTDWFVGTETRFVPKDGATTYYNSDYPGGRGVIGWTYGNGRVLSFSTTLGYHQIHNIPFSTLATNGIQWASGCPYDLDGDCCVGSSDLLILVASWGTTTYGPPDLDGDTLVGTGDLMRLLSAWGTCH